MAKKRIFENSIELAVPVELLYEYITVPKYIQKWNSSLTKFSVEDSTNLAKVPKFSFCADAILVEAEVLECIENKEYRLSIESAHYTSVEEYDLVPEGDLVSLRAKASIEFKSIHFKIFAFFFGFIMKAYYRSVFQKLKKIIEKDYLEKK